MDFYDLEFLWNTNMLLIYPQYRLSNQEHMLEHPYNTLRSKQEILKTGQGHKY